MDVTKVRLAIQLLALQGTCKVDCFPPISSDIKFAFSDADGSCDSAKDFLLLAAEDSVLYFLRSIELNQSASPISEQQEKCLKELLSLLENFAEGNVSTSDIDDNDSEWWASIENSATKCSDAFDWPVCNDPGTVACELIDYWKHG